MAQMLSPMRNLITSLILCVAGAASAAQYDFSYLQERADGKTEKVILTLTPGTYLSVDPITGKLRVQAKDDFRQAISAVTEAEAAAAAPVQSVAGKTGAVSLVKGDVGLSHVDDTADADKPVSSATQTALDAKVPTSRTVSAGTGLAGGGNLGANITISLASDAARVNLTGTNGALDLSQASLTLPTDVTRLGSDIALGGSEVSGTLPISKGGTGATDAATAFSNIKQNASTGATGVVAIATLGDAQTGTDTAKAVPSSVLAAWWTWIKTQAQTIAGNWIFQGNVTAGDALADSFSGLAGTLSFPNATNTANDRLANMGSVRGNVSDRLLALNAIAFPISYNAIGSAYRSSTGTGATISDGSMIGMRLNSGTASGAWNLVRVHGGNLGLGVSRTMPWTQRCRVAWRIPAMVSESGSQFRLTFGGHSVFTTSIAAAGALESAGIGILIEGASLKIEAHNGASLTTYTTSATMPGTLPYVIMLDASGGTVTCYLNGVSVGSTTGAPTVAWASSDALNISTINTGTVTNAYIDVSMMAIQIGE